MLRDWFQRYLAARQRRRPVKVRPPVWGRLRLENLEDRCVPTLTATATPLSGVEGQPLSSVVGSFTDTDTTVPLTSLAATINWGDGATTPASIQQSGPGSTFYFVNGTHTYAEETNGVPFTTTLTVTDTKNGQVSTGNSNATVNDAQLSPGNPVTPGTPATFTGVGTVNVGTAIGSFKAAVGGSDNGGVAQPVTGGLRTINWDAVKLDGTDFGGGANTTVINKGNTVGIPLNRFQARGVYFDAVYAVSGDGFVDVNPNVGGPNPTLFPAFTPKNTFAMFNDNSIDFKFVVPSVNNTAVAPAASRGFGAVFLNVQLANTTSIEYFNGNTSLGKFFVPAGTQGQPEFFGVLYNLPIVTGVTLTLGSDVLFSFNGATSNAGGAKDNAASGHNLVVTDDFFYAEPVPITNANNVISGGQATRNAQPILTALPNQAFTGVVATFSDANPNAASTDYTAVINWGDGHLSNGKIAANNKGGFDVTGTNSFFSPGLYALSVGVTDFAAGAKTLTVANTALVGTANQRLVSQLYLDLLQRPVDPAGLSFWGNQLDAGTPAQAVAQSIMGSPEFVNQEVNILFNHYLKRTAAASDLAFFSGFFKAGGTLEQAATDVVTSPEYAALNNNSANAIIASLYRDGLGRSPSSAELTMNASLTVTQLANNIFGSPEYQGHTIDVFFQDFLRRRADAAGVSFYSAVYPAGTVNGVQPDVAIISSLVGSPEYNDKVQANPLFQPVLPADPLKSSLS